MLCSKLFIPTLREAPAGIATAGARLLERAAYTRGSAHLYLGTRSLDRMARVLREHFGGQEISVSPDGFVALARELRSYKQLPQVWQRSSAVFEGCALALEAVDVAARVRAALDRCEVKYRAAEAVGGVEFVVACESGGRQVARAGDYVADVFAAVAVPKPADAPDPEGDLAPEAFHTPNKKTIAELAEFTGLPETSHIKSLVMNADGSLVMALLRGDHQLSEPKLKRLLRAAALRPANAEEIQKQFGAGAGSLGPVGVRGIRIVCDEALHGRRNMIAGANRDDFHLRHVTPVKDFACEFTDIRQVAAGDTRDGEPVAIESCIVLAETEQVDADLHVTGASGQEVPVHASAYRVFLERVLWAAAEQHHDDDGLVLPPAIAPFDLIISPVDYSGEPQQRAVAEIASAAEATRLEVLIDDRQERPGVKFKDADLIGIPWRVTIGKKLDQGLVEVVERRSKQKHDVPAAEAVDFIRTRR